MPPWLAVSVRAQSLDFLTLTCVFLPAGGPVSPATTSSTSVTGSSGLVAPVSACVGCGSGSAAPSFCSSCVANVAAGHRLKMRQKRNTCDQCYATFPKRAGERACTAHKWRVVRSLPAFSACLRTQHHARVAAGPAFRVALLVSRVVREWSAIHCRFGGAHGESMPSSSSGLPRLLLVQ